MCRPVNIQLAPELWFNIGWDREGVNWKTFDISSLEQKKMKSASKLIVQYYDFVEKSETAYVLIF